MTYLKKYPEYILLFLFVLIGVSSADAYGFAWDEYEQRAIGEVCYNYIFDNNLYYEVYPARDHGAIFELLLVIIEKISNLTTSRNIFLMRHIFSHLLFLTGAFYFYKLVFFLYEKKMLAIIGFLLLVINPTIYGHSFFNSKDVPFLSLFIICFYQFAITFKEKKNYQFFLLALFSCFLINIRIMGIIFVIFVLFFLVFDLFVFRKEKNSIKKHILFILLYLSSTIISTIIVWPLLWKNPLSNFLYSMKSLSKYPWDGTMMFKGELIHSQNVGWDYIPTWFCINTPIIYLILGFSGLILFLISLFKTLKKINLKAIDKNNLLYLFSFVAPVFVVIVLNSVLYDTWRHMFYIYPAFILLAIYFLNYCFKTSKKTIASAITITAIASVSFFMITNFPYQHVYFNQFITMHQGEYIRENYEMDYWGVNCNRSLEYILNTDHRDSIIVSSDNSACAANALMLNEEQKKRLTFTDTITKSDYFVTAYRWHPQDYKSNNLKEIKSFMVLGSRVNTIFKVKK